MLRRVMLVFLAVSLYAVDAPTLQVVGGGGRSGRCALVHRDACGWSSTGRFVYVENRSASDKRTCVVRETCNCSNRVWTDVRSYTLSPGDEERVGCTRGVVADERYTYTIVGERSRERKRRAR